MQMGADPDHLQAGTGRSVLYSAAWAGTAEIVRLLHSEYGADIRMTDDAGASPLWAAASEGHASVVTYLVQHGADTPVAKRLAALKLVRTCATNLANDPDNVKFRQLRIDKPAVQMVLINGFEKLLSRLGFERNHDRGLLTIRNLQQDQLQPVVDHVELLMRKVW